MSASGSQPFPASSGTTLRNVQSIGTRRTDVAVPLAEEALRAATYQIWASLAETPPDMDLAKTEKLIIRHTADPVGKLYDHLRSRLLHALADRHWKRVAIAAPTRGCGTSLIAANLALSLARRPSSRTVLIDLDLQQPSLHHKFGVSDPGVLRHLLSGRDSAEQHCLRLGRNLALGLNSHTESDAAELLQEPTTARALEGVLQDLYPDIVLYDMPPILENDAVFGFLPEVDGVLLVADGTQSTADEIRECERQITERSTLIGVVMNRAEDSPVKPARKRRWWF